jgi:hypothetical protein
MMRLIDLGSLIVEFNKRCRGECCCCEEDYCGSGNDGCGCRVIDEAPTVDAVEVVRCKDCRYYHIYWESNGHTEKGYGACDWINDNSVREDHFCSWGERREDATD